MGIFGQIDMIILKVHNPMYSGWNVNLKVYIL